MNIGIKNNVSKMTNSCLFFLGRKKYNNNNIFNISPFSTVKDGLTSYKGKNYPKETFTTFPVRWGDQDAMNHVNNVVYFQYFEQARGTWFIKHVNLPLSAVEAEKGNVAIAPILAQTSCKYKRPVVFPDTLTVGFTSEVVNAERGDFRHSYVVYSEQQDAVVAEGTADLVAYDYKNMKREKIPDNWTFLQT